MLNAFILYVLSMFLMGMNWIFFQAPTASFTNAGSFSPDGTNEMVGSIADSADFDATTELSFGCWVKGSGGVDFAGILAHWSAASRGYLIGVGGTGNNTKPRVQFCGSAGTSTCSQNKTVIADSAVIFDTAWHHVVATWDSGTILLYVDGSSVAWSYETDTGSFTTLFNSTANVTIANYDLSSFYMTGYVDECFIIKSVLSGATISSIYNSGSPNDLINDVGIAPSGWWRFESDSHYSNANGILDSSGNGNHGTGANLESGDINDPQVP